MDFRQTQNQKTRKHGFTLIELLVVISIIALLMSILVPALARAKDLARTVICLSNEKQQFLANSVYAEDYNGHYSTSFTIASMRPSRGIGASFTYIYERLEPYGPVQPPQDVRNPKGLWICPGDKPAKDYPDTYPSPTNPKGHQYVYLSRKYGQYQYISYGYNSASDMSWAAERYPDGYGMWRFSNVAVTRRTDEITRAGSTMMFVCSSGTRAFAYYPMAYTPFHRQGKAINILACDGHVETFSDFDPLADFPELYLELPVNWYNIHK